MSNQTLTVADTVRRVIQEEMKLIIEQPGAPYTKFILIATAIEFLGACMDKHDFTASSHSRDRFANALKGLFPKAYHKHAMKGSKIDLFKVFRCGMVHQFCPTDNSIWLTTKQGVEDGIEHMDESTGRLVLILEDLYVDLSAACEKLIQRFEKGDLPRNKSDQQFLQITDAYSGSTQTHIVKVKK